MGCCTSRPTSPYPSTASPPPNSSEAAINPSASHTALPRPSTHHTNSSSRNLTHSHSHRSRPPLAEHFNKPLRRQAWRTTTRTTDAEQERTWTRRQLERERTAFFDTRVSGRAEIWLAIQAAVGELRGSEGDEGVEGAQAILDAADATLPTGDLADGAYDALGAFYGVPQWVVRDPEGVEEGEEEEEEGETERRREEKGKGVLEGGGVKVKARLSERGGRDVVVVLGRGESVRVLARRVEVDGQLPPSKHVRIAYMGKVLKDSETLSAQGWKEGHVVNALVFG